MTLDTAAPVISVLNAPASPIQLVSGQSSATGSINYTVDGGAVQSRAYNLTPGAQSVSINATDAAGNASTVNVPITVLAYVPPVPAPTSTIPIVNGSGEFQDFMRENAAEVAGYSNIAYRNADNWHARVSTTWSSQLTVTSGPIGATSNFAEKNLEEEKAIFSNSSTAGSLMNSEDINRTNMRNAAWVDAKYQAFVDPVNPFFGFYPGWKSDGRS
ncbi:MAG: hypothetical protein Q8O48_01880, partial [Anaerolineales bacterium]|nr:hypothetical protein [Anaerolineales bacterium]